MTNLKELQQAVWENKVKHGFNTTDVPLEFSYTYGELAEAFHAYRKKLPDIGEELADVMIYLLGLATILHVDLEDELIKKIIEFESYIKNKEKFSIPGSIDISWTLNRDLFEEDAEFINKHKILYSILRAVKKIEQNKFGDWGIHNWREIKPKTINDKIYLIFKSHKKPMHFVEIADRINKIGFDAKKANPATVHNELILDGKYVLVGRGLYGLKEWGYKNGTVVNVIEEIFNESEKELLTRDEIVEKVLAKRMVKKATIILALMNKDKFAKEDGKYRLIKSI